MLTTVTPSLRSGYLGPGGKHLEWAAANCSGGAAGAADRLLLGAAHMYQGGARSVYGGLVTEPEGLLGMWGFLYKFSSCNGTSKRTEAFIYYLYLIY